MSIYYPTPEKTAPIEIFINLIWEINFSLATSMAACQKIVYPSQPNWSTYEPYRMTINSLHHENDHQWNKNFKLNPSVTFFFFSCAFLLILFFCFIPLYRWMWSRGCRPRSVKRYQYVQCISLLTYFFDLLSSLY